MDSKYAQMIQNPSKYLHANYQTLKSSLKFSSILGQNVRYDIYANLRNLITLLILSFMTWKYAQMTQNASKYQTTKFHFWRFLSKTPWKLRAPRVTGKPYYIYINIHNAITFLIFGFRTWKCAETTQHTEKYHPTKFQVLLIFIRNLRENSGRSGQWKYARFQKSISWKLKRFRPWKLVQIAHNTLK